MIQNPSPISHDSGKILHGVINKRKKSFLKSLEEILVVISNDRIVRDMIQEKNSSVFATDRIIEIITKIITDDREAFIALLFERLGKIEKIVMTDHIKRLKSIGLHLIDVMKDQNVDQLSSIRKIQAFQDQIQMLQQEIVSLRSIKTSETGNIKISSPKEDNLIKNWALQNELSSVLCIAKSIQTDSLSIHEMIGAMLDRHSKTLLIVRGQFNEKAREFSNKLKLNYDQQRVLQNQMKDIKSHYENNIIPTMLKEHESLIAQQQSYNNDLIKENSNLRLVLDKKEESISQLMNSEASLKNSIAIIQNHNQSLSDSIKGYKEMNTNLSDANSNLSDQLFEKNNEITKLSLQNEHTSSLYDESKEQLKRLEEEISNKSSIISSLSKESKELKFVNPVLIEENSDLKKSLDESNGKIDQLKDVLLSKQKIISDIEPKLVFYQAQLEQTKGKLLRITKDFDEIKQKLEEKESLLTDALLRVSKAESEKEGATFLNNSKDKQIERLEHEATSNQISLSGLHDRVKKLTFENEQANRQLVELQLLSSKQAATINSLNESHQSNMDSIMRLKQDNLELKTQNERLKSELESSNHQFDDLSHETHKLQERLAKETSDKEVYVKRAHEYMDMNRDIQNKLNEVETKQREQNSNLIKQKSYIHQLETDMQSAKARIEDFEKSLKTNNDVMKKEKEDKSSLDNELKHIKDKATKILNANKDLQKEYQQLHTAHFEAKQLIDELQNIIPVENPRDMIKIIASMKKNNNLNSDIMSLLGLSNTSDVVPRINELQNSAVALEKIHALFPGSSIELVSQIQAIKAENAKLMAQQKRISHLLSLEPNVDISNTIQDLIDKQTKIGEQLSLAADFISQALTIICGPTRLVFPLKQNQKEKMIEIITRIKSRHDNDHKAVEDIIEMAKKVGYEGENVKEATIFLTNSKVSSSASILSISNDTLDPQKLRKQILALRDSLSQQIEKSTKREESLINDVRRLQKEIDTHQRIRDEIRKVCEGEDADIKYLQSKLTKSELRILELTHRPNK